VPRLTLSSETGSLALKKGGVFFARRGTDRAHRTQRLSLSSKPKKPAYVARWLNQDRSLQDRSLQDRSRELRAWRRS
jgi:hypothetical protein